MPDQVHASSIAILFGPLLFAAELFTASGWRPWYFRNGLIVFRCDVSAALPVLPEVGPLGAAAGGKILPPILFRNLAPNELAFRESTTGFGLLHYIPLMHGHILGSPDRGRAVVTGRISWLLVLLVGSLLAVFGAWGEPRWVVLGIVVPVLVTLGIQTARYRRIVSELTSSGAAA